MTTRIMESPLGTVVRVAIISMLLVVLFCGPLAAQWVPPVPELRPFAGGYIPTGSHNSLLERAPVVGAQVAFELRDGMHGVVGFAWAATERRDVTSDRRVEMAQFDLGAEWQRIASGGTRPRLAPVAGVGVGLRAYRSRDTAAPSQANLAAYGALGAELALGRAAIRLESRDYVSAFRGLGGTAGTSLRNDITVALGAGYHFE